MSFGVNLKISWKSIEELPKSKGMQNTNYLQQKNILCQKIDRKQNGPNFGVIFTLKLRVLSHV